MRISVVTAAYCAADTVGQSIASVAAQTHPDLEHLVVEGASPDGTRTAIAAAAHPRMTMRSGPDGGIYDAINKGIARAAGDVVGLVHADDFLAYDGVVAQVARAFEDPDVEAVYGDLDYVDARRPAHVRRRWRAGPFRPDRLAFGWMPPHPTLYLRRSVFDRIGLYDTQYRIAGDYEFILRYFASDPPPPVYLPMVMVKMRAGGASNGSLRRVARKMREDRAALARHGRHGASGWATLACKSLRKIPQLAGRLKPGD
jgi:glycosyltransferase